jgi:toxin ParE1/3/4
MKARSFRKTISKPNFYLVRVEWSAPARDDLEELVRYISRDSVLYAQRFAERVVQAARKLKDFPLRGRAIPEAKDKTMRELIVQGYRLMYRVETQRILILALMHGRRDLTHPENQPWDA